MTRRLSFTVIEGGRRDDPGPAFVPDRHGDNNSVVGLANGILLAAPLWWGLSWLAAWAWSVRP